MCNLNQYYAWWENEWRTRQRNREIDEKIKANKLKDGKTNLEQTNK